MTEDERKAAVLIHLAEALAAMTGIGGELRALSLLGYAEDVEHAESLVLGVKQDLLELIREGA